MQFSLPPSSSFPQALSFISSALNILSQMQTKFFSTIFELAVTSTLWTKLPPSPHILFNNPPVMETNAFENRQIWNTTRFGFSIITLYPAFFVTPKLPLANIWWRKVSSKLSSPVITLVFSPSWFSNLEQRFHTSTTFHKTQHYRRLLNPCIIFLDRFDVKSSKFWNLYSDKCLPGVSVTAVSVSRFPSYILILFYNNFSKLIFSSCFESIHPTSFSAVFIWSPLKTQFLELYHYPFFADPQQSFLKRKTSFAFNSLFSNILFGRLS